MQHKKYISVSFAVILFFSTTGIPVALHLCRMMNEVTFKTCAMCSNSVDNDGIAKFKRQNCCGSKIIASPNSTQYLTNKQVDKETLTISDVITLQNDLDFAANINNVPISNSINSPPHKDIPLFLNNLSLLI